MTTALTTIAAPDRRPNPSKAATLAASDKTLAEIFAAIPDHQASQDSASKYKTD